MKKGIEFCSECNQETWHDRGRKESTTSTGASIRRTTLRCRRCGRREIVSGGKRRIIRGKNELPNDEE